MTEGKKFRFEISLSVLNHLGRNLYRNFITVLGEAISNSWDADAKNVWITIDKENSSLVIKDDGEGMTADDFQSKFLKVGYSKRKKGEQKTPLERPFIGAKGIGKLALLSCAKKISIFSKTKDTDYVGGIINNDGLDDAITNDLVPDQYPLDELDFSVVSDQVKDHSHGTIIHFEQTKDYLRNSIAHLKKLLAMNFRFSLLDENFNIFVNDELVSIDDLKDLSGNTEFCWSINNFSDAFMDSFSGDAANPVQMTTTLNVRGFLATVKKPRHLKITGTEERATVDLFVNGRLREKNILRHIPTQRLIESYIFGQIHFDDMDRPDRDPFTSSREGIVEDDENFQSLLDYLKREVLPQIMDQWDEFRLNRGEEGDEFFEKRASKKSRKIKSLYSTAKEEFEPEKGSESRDEVDEWLSELAPDAEFNISAYVDCFLSENLVRRYMHENGVQPSAPAKNEINTWRDREKELKAKANISFKIRKDDDDLSYLGMDYLAKSIEGKGSQEKKASLINDGINYKPVRNAVGHTGLLTENAKSHLNLVFENIKGRVRTLLSKRK